MAAHFKKIIDGINKELTERFKYDDEEDKPESTLDLNFISKLVQSYHEELKKNLQRITNSAKLNKPKLDKLAGLSEKEKEKVKTKFYEKYRKKLLAELSKEYPEIRNILKLGDITASSFALSVGPMVTKKFESELKSRVKAGLTLRKINNGQIEKSVNRSFGYESASIVAAHFNSVGFNDAYFAGGFDKEKASEVNKKIEEEEKEEGREKEKPTSYQQSLLNSANNDPGNWIITSGGFSGKTLHEVYAYMHEGDLAAKKENSRLYQEIEIKKKQIQKADQILKNKEAYIINQVKAITGKTYTYDQIKKVYGNFPLALQALIIAQEKRITAITVVRDKYLRLSDTQAKTSLRLRSLQNKAVNWILNTHATILANPTAVTLKFGKALSQDQIKGNKAFTTMFKLYAKSFEVYAKESGLIAEALNQRKVLAEEDSREDTPFYTLTQFYVGRDGVQRQKEVTRYKAPRMNEGGGFAPSDTFGSDRVFKRGGKDPVEAEVSKKRREEDFGLGGRNSILKGLIQGMSPHDRVKFSKLQDALRNMPKRTTKEWIVDPLTGEQRLMRKGSKLGLMMDYDKHGKLVWKEIDIYAKARKSLGGSLARIKQKEIEKQKLNLFVAESMLEEGLSRDREVKGRVAFITDAKNAGRTVAKGDVKGRKALEAKEADELRRQFDEDDVKDSSNYAFEFEEKRASYSEKIANAKTKEALNKAEAKIYENMSKGFHIVDPVLQKQMIDVSQIEKFRQDGDLLPEFYTGPTITLDTMKTMREYGSPASIKAVEKFHEAQLKYYSEGGKGRTATSYHKESEYELLDYQLPIATQIAIRRMELNNSGVKN